MTISAHHDDVIPVYGIPTRFVDDVWIQAAPILRQAVIDESDETIESVYEQIKDGNYHLWVIGPFDAIAVTQIMDRPLRRVAWIQYIAGKNMQKWFDAWIAALEHYAENEGCKAIEFAGRKGWLKHAKKHPDYKPTKTIFRRAL